MATWTKVVVENASGTIAQKSAGLVDADYGDITVSSNSFTIDNNVVDASALNVADNGTSGQVLSSDGDGTFSWVSNVTSVALNDITDVVESSEANLDVLSYDGTNSRWENKTLANAGIATKNHSHTIYAGLNGDATKNFSVLDLTLGGNDIKASDGTVAVTTSGANVTVAGDLTVGGSDIKASDGTTALTLADSTGNVTVAGDLTVTGTTITTATEKIEIADNTLVLNSDKTATADVDAGIIVERGGDGHNALFYWDEGDDRWCIGTNNEADLTSTPAYTGDVMLVRRDSSFDSNSTKVPVGHIQNISGVLYVRTA